MNQKQAKKEAITLIVALIRKEVHNPTDLTTYNQDDDFREQKDVQRILDEMEKIADQLSRRLS